MSQNSKLSRMWHGLNELRLFLWGIMLSLVGHFYLRSLAQESKAKKRLHITHLMGLTGLLLWVLIMGTAALHFLRDTLQQAPSAQIAYLAPITGAVPNIWIAPLDNPDAAQQITQTAMGVFDFDVSPDGRRIVYAARDSQTLLSELFLLDLRSGEVEQMTDCVAANSDCRTPTFHPNGLTIAFEEYSLADDADSGDHAGHHEEVVRIWLLDVVERPFDAHPLYIDPDFQGYSPQWGADGQSLIFYNPDPTTPGIMIYNFDLATEDRTVRQIPSFYGVTGALAPDGQRVVYPQARQYGNLSVSYLNLIDLSAGQAAETRPLIDTEAPIDDSVVIWHPAGESITIGRRYMDERFTRGYQIYQMDINSFEAEPLLVDERYHHGVFAWNATGDKLVLQRTPLLTQTGGAEINPRSEIWVYDHNTGDTTRIAEDAMMPRWVTP